jgi:hypothetical protein
MSEDREPIPNQIKLVKRKKKKYYSGGIFQLKWTDSKGIFGIVC